MYCIRRQQFLFFIFQLMSNKIPPVPVISAVLFMVMLLSSMKVTVHVSVLFDVNSFLGTLSLLDMLNILVVSSWVA